MIKLIIILFFLLNTSVFAQKDTVSVAMLVTDSLSRRLNRPATLKYGYDVRELRNSVNKDSSTVICCNYYWAHLFYLDENKILLNQNILVWGAIDTPHDMLYVKQ